ncbi:putative lipo domain protein, partial [Vibrio parahaemolyticus V-223/04]
GQRTTSIQSKRRGFLQPTRPCWTT